MISPWLGVPGASCREYNEGGCAETKLVVPLEKSRGIRVRAFSEDLIRVRDEILVLRQKRERLLSGVRQQSRDRKREVRQMLAGFLEDATDMARRRRSGRIVLLTGLRQTVSNLRRETREDLSGARQVLSSLGSNMRVGGVRLRQDQEAEIHAGRVEYSRQNTACGQHPRIRRNPRHRSSAAAGN
jgi:hypothetical protein